MMLLQFSIWGFSNAILSEYLGNTLHFTGWQIGLTFSMLPFALIISPILFGALADTRIPANKILFGLHIVCGLLAMALAHITSFPAWIVTFAIFCLAFAPTVPLVESISLKLLNSNKEDYSKIRAWGTIGWIAACLCLSISRWAATLGLFPVIEGDLFLFAGFASLLNAFHSLAYLHVPNSFCESPVNPYKSISLSLRNVNFRLFLACSFLMSFSVTICIILTPLYFASSVIGISSGNLPATISIGQISEVLVLYFLLSRCIDKFGIKRTYIIGAFTWFIRLFIFSVDSPAWLDVASLGLHGFSFAFVFANGVIYVDKVTDSTIQHTAQSLFSLVYMGLGSLSGSLATGFLYSVLSTGNHINWNHIFAVPTTIILIQIILFTIYFKGPTKDPMVKAISA